ncbi:MAG: hypothetical protein F6K16_30175 [Symploca sp. SIO2B6]|nr:hypothetical protein [Symploca sp. SIO2B6]
MIDLLALMAVCFIVWYVWTFFEKWLYQNREAIYAALFSACVAFLVIRSFPNAILSKLGFM